MSEVTLRVMTPAEFATWQQQIAEAYAEEQVSVGNWSADEALELSLASNAEGLPEGLNTPGMLMLMAVRPDGEAIGRLWIGLNHPRGIADCAFLYDIEVDAGHRGQGLGRALLEAAERVVAEHGVGALELNVFGNNPVAIALYDSAGYRVTTQQMRKHLSA